VIQESLVILEESTGQQYRFGMPGPEFQEQEWKQFLGGLAAFEPTPDYLVASGSLPPGVTADFYARVARVGKNRGSKTIIDVSGEGLEQAFKEGAYLTKPNFREFRELVGEHIKEEPQIKPEVQKMVKSGRCEILVISLGAAAVMTPGTELCRREDAERLFESMVSGS
jgi:6-phosphofructokinase 2